MFLWFCRENKTEYVLKNRISERKTPACLLIQQVRKEHLSETLSAEGRVFQRTHGPWTGILHCNSFRRLKHKTQVYLSPAGDHYRTRLTHTLEVSQIARTISRALRPQTKISPKLSHWVMTLDIRLLVMQEKGLSRA